MSNDWEKLAEKAAKLVSETGESLKTAEAVPDMEELKKLAGDLGEEAASFVRRYPLPSVLGAAAAGFLLGVALGRKK